MRQKNTGERNERKNTGNREEADRLEKGWKDTGGRNGLMREMQCRCGGKADWGTLR